MTYATVAEMASRYQRRNLDLLTKTRTDNNQPDDVIIDAALADATAMMDSYIVARYTLPLTVAPATLPQVCCVIAWYFLQDTRATEQSTQRYKDAIRWLEGVRDGKIPLGTDTAGSAPDGENRAQVVSDAPVFSRKQQGFI